MATKKYIMSEEAKKKMSRDKKEGYANGKFKSWDKGRKETRKEVLEKLSKSHIGQRAWNKGKTGTLKHTEEHKKKMSELLKGRIMSKETRKKISESRNGIKLSEETKRRISVSKTGKKLNGIAWNKGLTKETDSRIKKMSESLKGKKYPVEKYPNSGWRNKHPSEEIKKKLRLAAIKYIEETCGGITPMLGHNEKTILDELEAEYGYEIIRQYKVEGYFLDGYIKELKLVIEVDEKPKTTERDFNRQKQIEKKLNCKFLRIKDYKNRIRTKTKFKEENKWYLKK